MSSMTIARMSRRAVLRWCGAAALLAGAVVELTACGGTGTSAVPSGPTAGTASSAAPPSSTAVSQTAPAHLATVPAATPTGAPGRVAASGTLRAVYLGSGDQAKVSQDILGRFGKEHPSIHVEDGGGKGYAADLVPLIAAGTPPDWALLNATVDEVTLG